MTWVPRPAPHTTTLAEICKPAGGFKIIGDSSVLISGLELDSRSVHRGDLFAALPGHLTHGSAFAPAAVAAGAAAVLTDAAGAKVFAAAGKLNVPIVVVADPRLRLGELAAQIYRTSAVNGVESAPRIFGVTGTNGKTTVTYLIDAGLRAAGRITGLVGTVEVRIGGESLSAIRTTPEAPHLHALLAVMEERGVQDVAIEVSSHALVEGRVGGMRFAIVAFTNLSQDHLDYHGTMEEYFLAKAALFTPDRADLAVIGIDDPWGARLAAETVIPVVTWSTNGGKADWSLVRAEGQDIAAGPGGENQVLRSQLPGEFNRANILCAYVILRSAGIAAQQAAAGIASVTVPGRMETVGTFGGVTGIVDYAHTPDAIEGAITCARQSCSGTLIVVVGAGGDRDRQKRAAMGKSAARLADHVFVTDDNPRSEDPASIRAAILAGAGTVNSPGRGQLWAVTEIADRRIAIGQAVSIGRPGDTVLVLGKGHEQGQEISGVVFPFDDRDELRAALGVRAEDGT